MNKHKSKIIKKRFNKLIISGLIAGNLISPAMVNASDITTEMNPMSRDRYINHTVIRREIEDDLPLLIQDRYFNLGIIEIIEEQIEAQRLEDIRIEEERVQREKERIAKEKEDREVEMRKKDYTPKDDLNMRSEPSAESTLLVTIPQGKKVNFITEVGEWYKVTYGKHEGFVSSEYIALFGTVREKPSGREKLIATSKQLLGKVPYFWGGKSSAGWNNSWNKQRKVTSAGSSSSGSYRPYGLDCSGFVDRSFKTAGFGNVMEGGTGSQWGKSSPISRSELQIGDLGFKQAPSSSGINHVGIYVGKNSSGQELFIHCASGRGVVITTARGGSLNTFRRPKVNF